MAGVSISARLWLGLGLIALGALALFPAATMHVGATGGFWGPDAYCFSPGRTTPLALGHCAWCFAALAGFVSGAVFLALEAFDDTPTRRAGAVS